MNQAQQARFVWCAEPESRRDAYARFRFSFDAGAELPASATLCCYADTVYQLFVNGHFIEFGPARSDPRFPLFDRHDLGSALQAGENCIEVRVKHFGQKTYKAICAAPALIAWGLVELSDGSSLDLATHAASAWQACADPAHQRYAPKISFALDTAELADQGAGEAVWGPVCEIAEQDAWGELAERSIPFMKGQELPLGRLLAAQPLRAAERLFSFRVPVPFFYEDDKSDWCRRILYQTWIYSPCEQDVQVGLFWGDHWLDGEPVPTPQVDGRRSLRQDAVWHLKAGWTHLAGMVNAYADCFDFYMAVPADSGVDVSAERDLEHPVLFRRSPILKAEQGSHLEQLALPFEPDTDLSAVGGWVDCCAEDRAQSPARETSWDGLGGPIEALDLGSLQGHVFSRQCYPDGISLVFDLGQTRLFFPQIELEGTEGCTVDITYSEQLMGSNSGLLLHQFLYQGADRIICGGNACTWRPIQPRGGRYCRVTVRGGKHDITLRRLSLRGAHYPVESIGSFRCSDPSLSAIWSAGERTQAVNMEDAYVDCVGRERGMYSRDAIIQYHINAVTFGDQALMRRCLQLYGESPAPDGRYRAVVPNTGAYTIGDFALNTIEGFERFHLLSGGDLDLIRDYWPTLLSTLDWYNELAEYLDDDGVLDTTWPEKRGVEAMYGGYHGDNTMKDLQDNVGPNCAFSCMYLIALRSTERLALALGEQERSVDCRTRIEQLERSIPARFWDADKGCYADSAAKRTHSTHPNVLAVMAGLTSSEQEASIRCHLRQVLQSLFVNGYDPAAGTQFSSHFSFYIFDGLYRLGLADVAQRCMREGWTWALAQGLATTPEFFRLGCSHCHAWASSPTYHLSRQVLGIDFPEAPDLDQVRVAIQAPGITWAEGSVPHPRGRIDIAWKRQADGRIAIERLTGPEGVSFDVDSIAVGAE